MLTGSSFLSYQNAPLQSIRDAIKDSEHHIVRVNEEGTGEIYDLDLSHTAPYAHPVNRREGGTTSGKYGNARHGQADVSDEKSTNISGSSTTPDGSPQQTTAPSTGRKILQLPQIVSRRNAQNSTSPLNPTPNGAPPAEAQSSTPTQDTQSSSPKEGVQSRYSTASNGFAHPLRQPAAGELPPSPPLEPDMHSYITGSMADGKQGKADGVGQATKQARNGDLRRQKPVRSATDDVAALRSHHDAVVREPSTASFASTSYQSATSQKADSDEELGAVAGGSRFLGNVPLTAEPASDLLHPASASHDDAMSSNRSPAKLNPRQAMASRRNTTGAQVPRRRPGSVGSTGTRDSRRSSRERDLSAGPGDGYFDPLTLSASQSNVGTAPLRTGDAGFDDVIAKKYDEIRRERVSKKIREQQTSVGKEGGENAQQENTLRGGAALVRGRSGRRQTMDEPKALIGNVIGEGHSNYVLMYNMLTGIRIGVSRCQAKMKRPLTDADYSAKHKFTFDIIGNELTPSAKYDFKFKDYAPWVFRELREHFHLDAADYLLSLTAKYILSELGSPGKSGSFFYFSRDYRFIIKTIRHNEHKFLLRILKDYHLHVKENPHTLLSRFYGLHRVKLPGGKKIHFVIMNNLFPPHRDIHETYDLKGSAIGREYPEEKAAQKKGAVLKDLNWIKRGRELEFGPAKRALLESQVRSDVALLQRLGIMDYSLLIGLHDMNRGNKEGLRQDALQVVQPDNAAKAQAAAANGGPPGQLRREPTTRTEKEAYALRAAVRRSDAKALNSSSTAKLPERETSDRHHFIFYQDEGGYRSTDENNNPTEWIYYFGIIDTLTLYNSVKRSEHYWKSLTHNSKMISSIHPVAYGNRFCDFLFSLIKGADKSRRPRMQ
jgi:1-phosphatidylinositol-4-phosphate 5-kinase